ncbi:uncharacterized protein HKW66_Vig0151230 [Vigna angularis]|uniref:Uncharacterized protein n=1 Tax=Phaseolus angularis TaxID=3914 RepID=A0A8T0JUC1_PHAAN|nr:uncharacterized protein HKW66_Vig0151230 [Vigna angularis]
MGLGCGDPIGWPMGGGLRNEREVLLNTTSMINDTEGIGERCLKNWLNIGGPNNRSMKVWDLGGVNAMSAESVRGSFELTSSNIGQLKQHAKSKLGENAHVSTYLVACAYMLQCLVKAEQPKTDGVAFLFSVDCRTRMETPISSTYFGNCIMGHKVMDGTRKLLGDDGFINGVEGMNEALKKLEDGVFSEAVVSDHKKIFWDVCVKAPDGTDDATYFPLLPFLHIQFFPSGMGTLCQ